MPAFVRSLRMYLAMAGLVAVAAGCAAPMDPASRAQTSLGVPRTVELLRLDPATLTGLAAFGQSAAAGVYLPGPGDRLALHVIDAPELSLPGGYPVAADGTILLPFLGAVRVADRPLDQTREEIATRLRPYLPLPQVDLRVSEFNARHVSVVGAVQQPGRYSLTDRPMSVIDAINAAGGFADPLRATAVTILRGGMEIGVDMDAFLTRGTPLPQLRDGDVVQLGGTRAPVQAHRESVRLHAGAHARDLALSQAPLLSHAAMAGGAGFGDTVHVLRADGARLLALHLTGADALDASIGGRFALAPGDSVVVSPGPALGQADHMARLARPLAEF